MMNMLGLGHRRGSALCFSLLLGWCAAVAYSQAPDLPGEDPADAPAAAETAVEQAQEVMTPPVHRGAQVYMMKCLGCHTVGGGALSGPDLKPTLTWPRENLANAIRRMEQQVGPMSEEEVEDLTDLLLNPEAPALLDAERQRMVQQRARDMEPASAAVGRMFFEGRRPLSHGGLACTACHEAGGRGGNLASSLTNVSLRMDEFGLRSAIEGANFPLMKPIYEHRPVTPEEAAHIAKYLESVEGGEPARALSSLLGLAGFGGAGIFLAAMAFGHPRRKHGTRAQLVADSTQYSSRSNARK